jgi:hypothetical protein
VADARIQGQRDTLAGESLRDREVAGPEAEVAVRGRKVRWLGIVAARFDATVCEEGSQTLRLRDAHDEQMPNRLASLRLRRKPHSVESGECLRVVRGRRSALLVPPVQERKLLEQDDRLERVQAGGVPDVLVVVLICFAVAAERANPVGEVTVVGDERSGVTHRTEVLRRIEAERGRTCEPAGPDSIAARTMCLTRVLNDRHVVRASDVGQRAHVGQLTVEVDRHQVRCVCGRTLRLPDVHGVVVVIDVEHHRHAAGLEHCLERGRERSGRHDDAGATLDARRLEAEPQRVEAARDADALTATGSMGERELELCDGSTVHEVAGVDRLRNPVEDARLDGGVRGAEVNEGNPFFGFECVEGGRTHSRVIAANRSGSSNQEKGIRSAWRTPGGTTGLHAVCARSFAPKSRRGWHESVTDADLPRTGVYNRGVDAEKVDRMSRRPVLIAALFLAAVVATTASAGRAPGQQPPLNIAAPTISGTPQVGSAMTASTGTWSGKNVKYGLQWLGCDTSGGNCAPVSGATASTYVVASSLAGLTLRILVVATNKNGSTAATSAATPLISAGASSPPTSPTSQPVTAPSVTSLPTISGTPQQGQTVTASTGSWSGTTPITYGYQWQRCDNGGGACVPIAGATATSLLLGSADVGATVRVSVGASNSVGSATASSAATAVVTAAPIGDTPSYPAGAIPTLGTIRFNDFATTTTRSMWTRIVAGNNASDITAMEASAAPKKYIYVDPLAVVQGSAVYGVSYEQAQACHALATDSAGNAIHFSQYTGDYLPVLDNACFENTFEQNMLAILQAHPKITGLRYDNVDIDYHNLVGSTAATQYPDNATWRAKSKAFYTNVNQFFQSRGYEIAGNAQAWWSGDSVGTNDGDLTKQWWNYLTFPATGTFRPGKSLFDALEIEFWQQLPSSAPWVKLSGTARNYPEYWDNWLSLVPLAHSLGAAFVANEQSSGTSHDDQVARYTRASLLLEWQGGYDAIFWRRTTSSTSLPDDPSYAYNLGSPLGAKATPQPNVSKRQFERGFVIVNHSYNTITQDGYTISSGDARIVQTS